MILSLVEKHIALTKRGSHYVGACPICGGGKNADAFTVDINKDFVHCYACGVNLDPVRFLRQIEGKTCPEAHRTLGITCDRPECPVWEKCSRGRGDIVTTAKDNRPHVPRPVTPVVSVATDPGELWREKAAALVEAAHKTLLDTPAQLEYLAGRGLPLGAVIKNKLGYLTDDVYRSRASWGLSDELRSDGKPKKLWIPAGIVIPSFNQSGTGEIHRIRIRKDIVKNDNDLRYYWLTGSGDDIICLNPSAQVHVVVEADLDGMAIDWAAGDIVATVLLGSCSARPKAVAWESLQNSQRILLAMDFDAPRWHEKQGRMIAPGAEACNWWLTHFPETWKRWPVSGGKDPGEAFKAGIDLRAWVVSGLPPVFSLSTAVATPATPIKGVSAAQSDPNKQTVVTMRTAADGRTFYITDNKTEYTRLVAAGEIVFDYTEMQMAIKSGATAKEAALFLTAKQTFPGVRLTEVVLLAETDSGYIS